MTSVAVANIEVLDDAELPCRMRKKAVQQGRSEQSGESYSVPYVEPLSEARTPLVDFFRILLEKRRPLFLRGRTPSTHAYRHNGLRPVWHPPPMGWARYDFKIVSAEFVRGESGGDS